MCCHGHPFRGKALCVSRQFYPYSLFSLSELRLIYNIFSLLPSGCASLSLLHWVGRTIFSEKTAMASNGNHFSPFGGQETPNGNSNSSQTPRRSSRRRTNNSNSSPASSPLPLETPPSHLAGLASTPSTTSRRRGAQHNPNATPSTPLSTDDAVPPYSSDRDENDNMETDGQDDTTPVFVWGTNISVQEVNGAILRFLRHFRDARLASESSKADVMSEVVVFI